MDMRKFSGSGFLKVADLEANGPLRVVIADVREGKYGKPDLEFDDGSKLSVNATNNRTLVNAYGGNSDDWLGQEIELGLGQVEYQGTLQESILVKPISRPTEKRPLPQAKPRKALVSNLDDEVPF